MSIKPKLGLFDTIAVVISLIIGIGIFRTPSIVARNTGSVELFFIAWIIGGIICLLGGLVFAEIGARKPFPGAYYKVVSEAYNPVFAFMINWLGIIVTSGAAFAAVSLIASEYLIHAIGDIQPYINYDLLLTISGKKTVALFIVLLLFLINYIGIKCGAIFLNLITTLKILIIVLLSIISLIYSGNPTSNIEHNSINNLDGNIFSILFGFFLGLRAVFFTVGGYQLTINLAADVKNQQKNLPRGIIIGVIVSMGLYILINIGYYKLLGFEGICKSELIAADIANIIFGNFGGRITSIIIFISAIGFMNASIIYTPRAYYAMASDRVLPKIFMKINEKKQVQEFGLFFMFILVSFFILTMESFEKILNVIMFNDLLSIAVVASVIFILRYRESKNNITWDGFKLPLYPVFPIIFILFLLLVSIRAFYEDIIGGSLSIVVFLLGYPLYKILNKSVK
ncbi:MAG: amino acid permease [Ignavibacteria bacterium]|nr:amino acid permease [Ignavibacteria bacterium]